MNHEGRAIVTTDGLEQTQDGLFNPMLLDWISTPAQSGQEMQWFDSGELSYGGIDLSLDGQMLQRTAARSLDAQGKATDSQPSSLGHNQTGAFGVETDVHPQHDKQGAFISARSSTVSMVQELAKLSAGLAEHAATVPPHSIYDSPHICPFGSEPETTTSELSLNQTAWNGRSSLCPKCFGKGHVFSIDQTFRHTEKLLELYSRLINSIVIADANPDQLLKTAGSSNTSRRISPTTTNPVILDDSHTPADGESHPGHGISNEGPSFFSPSISNLVPPPTAKFDHASILHLVSCHHRLIDVWFGIIGHLKAQNKRHPDPKEIDYHCAKLTIGSHTLSGPTARVMYMTLIVDLTKKLSAQARQLVDRVEAAESCPRISSVVHCPTDTSSPRSDPRRNDLLNIESSDPLLDATLITCRTVMNRASRLTKQIDCIQK